MKKTFILFIALSGIASLLNYITYPVLSRILPSEQFVNITVALSLLTQISTFLSSVIAITIGLSKEHDPASAKKIIEILQSVLMQIFVVVVVVFISLSPFVFHTLDLPFGFITPICLLMLFSIPTAIISGFLNGKGKLQQLGLVALFVAVLQLILSVFFGLITKNGIAALNGMALGQLISIAATYLVFKQENLPHIYSTLSHKLKDYTSPLVKKLVVYTLFASLGIMAVNVLQIADLLIIKGLGVNSYEYAQIYIVSRVVFFAGTIFIWPYLSTLDITNPQKNVLPTLKLIGLFGIISLGAMVGYALFQAQITNVLFGSPLRSADITYLGLLSILYKFIFLIVITLTLYFIVLRSYWAIFLPLLLVGLIGAFTVGLHENNSTAHILVGLSLIGLLALVPSMFIFWKTSTRPRPSM